MISSPKKNPEQAQASNRILVGTNIQGDVQTDGDMRIDGAVKGNLKIAGKLVIGEHGSVEGEVACKDAAIAGRMKGTIKVSQMLSMTASANVEGQVFTEKLSVEPGANLNGTVSMGAVMRSIEDKKEGDKSAKTA